MTRLSGPRIYWERKLGEWSVYIDGKRFYVVGFPR